MGTFANAYGPHAPERTYVEHLYPEQVFDTGEVLINYARVGTRGAPPLLLHGSGDSSITFQFIVDELKNDWSARIDLPQYQVRDVHRCLASVD